MSGKKRLLRDIGFIVLLVVVAVLVVSASLAVCRPQGGALASFTYWLAIVWAYVRQVLQFAVLIIALVEVGVQHLDGTDGET